MQTVLLKIDGMEGEACADKITQLLTDTAGVADVRVSLRDGSATVRINEAQTSPHLLSRPLAQAGYPSYASADAPPTAGGGCCGGCCGG
jgi:copper chaperone CopZ